jgi:hypothetical protein
MYMMITEAYPINNYSLAGVKENTQMSRTGLAVGLNKGHVTNPLEKRIKPSHRKGVRIIPLPPV